MRKSNAATFLENMKQEAKPLGAPVPVVVEKTVQKNSDGKSVPKTREGLKHLGGYCDPDTVEKFAILRARLALDNSECITLAIQELYSKQQAKKAFND